MCIISMRKERCLSLGQEKRFQYARKHKIKGKKILHEDDIIPSSATKVKFKVSELRIRCRTMEERNN